MRKLNVAALLDRASLIDLVPVAATAFLLSACTNPGTAALGTNVPLTRAPDLAGAATPGVEIWRSPDLAHEEQRASAYFIPPATVYRGSGSDFGTLSPAQVDTIAAELTQDVRTAIGRRFKVVDAPRRGAFTLNLVLVKLSQPHPAYISNGPYDWSPAVIGMPDAQRIDAGVLTVAGKFIDSATGKLLVGFVAPVSPQVMDIDAVTPSRFAQAASQQFASDLVAAIVRQRQIGGVSVGQ
jgi:Protein of unknown function (DUF3313)